MNFLRDLALAHQKHEGWFVGSLSQRNNNPGNLRLTGYQMRAYNAVQGQGGFARFPTYEIGLQALMDDLRAKITGNSAHIDYMDNPTFLDYVKVYAPAGDGNAPAAYCWALIKSLPQYPLSPDTPLTFLAGLITGAVPPKPMDLRLRLRIALAALERLEDGPRKKLLTRLIKRLQRLLGEG